MIGGIAFNQTSNFVLTCVPMFLLMGQFLNYSGIASDLYEIGYKWMGRLRGGLAMASVMACAAMGAITGSSSATAATIGSFAIPEMKKKGYDTKLAVGSMSAAGTLAILIPPSVPMILYGSITDTSVGKLFIAGLIPGIMLATIFILYIGIVARRRPGYAPPGISFPWKDRVLSLRKGWTVGALFTIVLGTIYLGVCTPSEAGALGALGALVIATLAYRTMNRENFIEAILATIKTTTMILMIVVGAMIFAYILTLAQIPMNICTWVSSLPVSKWGVLIGINIFLLVMGFFMDVAAIIFITMPIIFPIIIKLGFDPIWFGVLVTVNMEMAMITPPIGLNLFIIKGVSTATFGEIIRGSFPFLICTILALAILMLFPDIALWLPSMME